MDKVKKPKPVATAIIYSAAFLLTLGVAITAQVVTSYYDSVIRDFMGVLGKKTVNEVNDGLDKQYNKKKFETVKELDDYERELVRDIGGEGYVLLKIEDHSLPLAAKS